MPQIPPLYLQILQKLAISIVVVCLAVVVSRVAARLLRKRAQGDPQMQTLSVLVRKITYILAVVIILVVVFELGSNFAPFGIPAGVAFTSQGDRSFRLPEHNHQRILLGSATGYGWQCRQ